MEHVTTGNQPSVGRQERLVMEGDRTGKKQVEFVCHAPEAKAVFLAGTFNG